MKKLMFLAALYLVALQFSCTNDFEINADWKDIPITYGLIDISDTALYIRVERAFLTDGEDASDIAKIPDSIYYQDAKVSLERVSNGQVFAMQRVDGNLWGFPREEGDFATSPNWLYRLDSTDIKLKPDEQIRIRIDRGNGLPEVTSNVVVLDKMELAKPGGASFNFAGSEFEQTEIAWLAPDSATIFDVNLYFNYVEYPASNPADQSSHTVKWPWVQGLRRESSSPNFNQKKPGLEFYRHLANNIQVDPALKRVFTGIDIEIIGGDEYVKNYVNASLANTGITASQEIPTYSNMSEGKGVFGSITKFKKLGMLLNDKTRDSLKAGYLTRELNF
jgi:hypothetical protein